MNLRFACLLLAAWSAIAAVPTPESYFGHPIGADRTVLDWEKVVGYFQALLNLDASQHRLVSRCAKCSRSTSLLS